MNILICKKKVDWSLLKEGFTFPKEIHTLLREKTGYELNVGDKHIINILINDKKFQAQLINLNFDRNKYPNNTEIIQIRYSPNGDFSQFLKTIFRTSYQYISEQREQNRNIRGTSNLTPEFLNIYSTESPDTFRGEAITVQSVFDKKDVSEFPSKPQFSENDEEKHPKSTAFPSSYTSGFSLAEVFDQVQLPTENTSTAKQDTAPKEKSVNISYWWLNANPKMWSMAASPVGEIQDYTLYNDKQHKRRIFQNFLDAKIGDLVVGYESTPVKQIVALFQIAGEQDGERIYFKKIEHLASPIDLSSLQALPELEEMEFFKNSQATLLKLSAEEYDCILNLIRETNPLLQARKIEKYSPEQFLSEVFIQKKTYNSLVQILKHKKNIILQGAPGVGKTFAAKRLAYSIMGAKDESRIEFVQFHQNYSYEDFVMGYKPNENGFELKNGVFYSFCQKAASNPDKEYFFIIDEINRGNMSKIFGELLMLIEKDYRNTPLTLAYNGLSFRVPGNLYIIGMMNTADRSLAMIDYALRRRFSFFDITPGFDSYGFKAYQAGLQSEKLDKLVNEIKLLNNAIIDDKSLGKGFCIGHSYLCSTQSCSDEWLQGVVEYDILPMLAEYWFDEPEKYEDWQKRLTDAVK